MRLSQLLKLPFRFFSQQPQDPDLSLLIRNYLSTYSGKEKIINFMDEVEYYDKNPDLDKSKNLALELKNDEVTNLLSFVSNNLNRELCNIFFYTCKYIYNEWKNKIN